MVGAPGLGPGGRRFESVQPDCVREHFVKERSLPSRVELEEQLEVLLRPMSLPVHKKVRPFSGQCISWLEKNMSVRNESNPNYGSAMGVIRELRGRS